ncbi:hypothetical protein [Ornithinimicrobium sp. W1665]|uniref:hypothetical protein n=1 Tax=Ornithinimicrobium sp. W1665 TaxID=3416666 RepID=UPI003D6B9E91
MSVRSLADDLRGRSDEELAALLRARPDLARPTPADVTTLAARATTLASVRRALDHLDLAHLQALEAVVVAAPAGPAEVAALLGTSAERAEALTGRLRTLALCWISADGLLPARPVLEVVGDPAGLAAADVRPSPGVSADPDGALADLDPPGRQLLDALTWGPAVGTLPQDPDAPMATAARSLVEAGLLVRQDEARTWSCPACWPCGCGRAACTATRPRSRPPWRRPGWTRRSSTPPRAAGPGTCWSW